MQTDALTLLQKQMEEEKVSVVDALVSAAAADHAEYRAMCGQIRGLAIAQRLVADMEKRLQRQEE